MPSSGAKDDSSDHLFRRVDSLAEPGHCTGSDERAVSDRATWRRKNEVLAKAVAIQEAYDFSRKGMKMLVVCSELKLAPP